MIKKMFPLFIATLGIALITLVARLTDIDTDITALFYDPALGFPLKDNLIVTFFYRSINISVVLSLLFFLLYPFLYWKIKKTRPYWRIVLALFLALAIGPGLIVNTIFKENYGRPRPSQTIEFGGDHQPRQVLESNWGNYGKSFPSGHAAVPLTFLLLAFCATQRKRHRLAKNLTIVIVAWYIAVSMARIVAGGHHFTDVLWGGYIAFVSAWLGYWWIASKPTFKDLKK